MYFKVKWEDFLREFNRKITSENDFRVKYYFETDTSFLIFLGFYGIIQYCEVLKKDISINSFKKEYFSNTIELLNNPLKK